MANRESEISIKHQYVYIYTVSKKLCKLIFCQNFVKFRPIMKIFGRKIAKLFRCVLILIDE